MNAAGPQTRRLPTDRRTLRLCRRYRWIGCSLLFLIVLSHVHAVSATTKRTTSPLKPKGVVHIVQQGQTLFRISQAYDVKVATLVEVNRIKPSTPLRVGQRLLIPGAATIKRVEMSRPLTTDERDVLERSLREELTMPPSQSTPPPPPRPRVKTDADFAWPIVGPVNSPFGPRWSRFHAGIDIGSPHYQEVGAAADGEVLYARDTGGPLGKAIVLQHGRGMRTVYAHLSVIVAREADTVRQGQAIGGVGDTGRTTGPHLHFEVRRNGTPVNPEDYLPATIDELVRDLSAPRSSGAGVAR